MYFQHLLTALLLFLSIAGLHCWWCVATNSSFLSSKQYLKVGVLLIFTTAVLEWYCNCLIFPEQRISVFSNCLSIVGQNIRLVQYHSAVIK